MADTAYMVQSAAKSAAGRQERRHLELQVLIPVISTTSRLNSGAARSSPVRDGPTAG